MSENIFSSLKTLAQESPCLSVGDLNNQIKDIIEWSPELKNVWVKGEITSFKIYQGRMAYITLADATSQINGVIFVNSLNALQFKPEVGLTVYALGKVTLFQKRGSINFQVHFMSSEGPGKMSNAFDKLKEKLVSEGLFEPSRKKPIPKYPNNIALITSYDSAAMWDFITLSRSHMRHVKLAIFPATVQGERAPLSLQSALAQVIENQSQFDCVVILRGGGSAEDLACFNQEELVRAIANCPLPTISAIGHEVDTTLSDFAADMRAATPSAAVHNLAEYIIHAKSKLPNLIVQLKTQITNKHVNQVNAYQTYLIDIQDAINHRLATHQLHFEKLLYRLTIANPLLKMKQGYSILRNFKEKTLIRSIKDISENQDILIEVQDGFIRAKTTEIRHNK